LIESRTGVVASAALPLGEFHRVGPDAGRVVGGAGDVSGDVLGGVRLGSLGSVQGRAGYVSAVGRALAYIRAGDVYQANIAHELRGRVSGSAAGVYGALVRGALPRHGMGVVGAPLGAGVGYAVLSLSPELFLSFDAGTRRLVTRPMKGTRPWDGDERELRDAEKDRAELAMIVDLMRNDLGRVCEFGSVRVDTAREIERHGVGAGAVLQATATVSGVVRAGVGIGEILGATFPPGSVTGTPKVRAMQVIDELEPFSRGPYCGCIGTIGDDGSFELAVSIRTAVVRGAVDGAGEFVDAEFSYSVGAGIVADSDPEAEWEETMAKARVLEPVFEMKDEG
jgi:anthranilate/para-aminobenzoate synthase component I